MKHLLYRYTLTMLLCAVPILVGAQNPASVSGSHFTFESESAEINLSMRYNKTTFPWIDLNESGTYEEGEELDIDSGGNCSINLPYKEGRHTIYVGGLTELYCSGNQLTALDVSKNAALTELGCASNQLTALDVSKNAVLTMLGCWENLISDTAMTVLINTLPDRTDREEGYCVIANDSFSEILLAKAKTKNWKIVDIFGNEIKAE